MRKLPANIPNPFEFRDNIQKLEKANAKAHTLQERILEIIEGEQPKDSMSWEFYIWKKAHDPLGSR